MSSSAHGLERIRALAQQAERRIRLSRTLHVGTRALCVALGVAIVDIALRKVGVLGEGTTRVILALAGVGLAAACAVAWSWRLPE